jgi:hypothetical protein
MKQAPVVRHHMKEHSNTHQNSAEEADLDASRADTQQGGGHRSGSSGAGTSEKLDRERRNTGPTGVSQP